MIAGTGVVIPLSRLKEVATSALAARFERTGQGPGTGTGWHRSPPKSDEMRASRPAGRDGVRLEDSLAGRGRAALAQLKVVRHVRRNVKLRLFRVFKLFSEATKHADQGAPGYRAVGERLKTLGWMRRL